jgi:hypothetical protein
MFQCLPRAVVSDATNWGSGFDSAITPLVLGQRSLATIAAQTVIKTAAIKGCVREIIRGTLRNQAANANTMPIDTALSVFCNESEKPFIACDPNGLSQSNEEVLAHVLAAVIDRHVALPHCDKGDLHYQSAVRRVQQ